MKNIINFIIVFLILSTAIAVVMLKMSYSDSCDCEIPKTDTPQPSKQRLERDGKQLARDFINTVEYYRLALQSDTMDWNDSHDPANFYFPYAQRETIDSVYVASPLPTSSQIKVFVDTILYNADGNICFALLIIKAKYSDFKNFQKEFKTYPYSACAIVGYRENNSMPYTLYPVNAFSAMSDTYKEAKRVIRECYFLSLNQATGDYYSVFNQQPYKYNIGDPKFFDESPLFQKYDSTRYNFQMYHNEGNNYEYPIRIASSINNSVVANE